MIIDFHTHIFSADVCRNREPFLADGQFQSIYGMAGAPLIDHRDLANFMLRSGIDRAVAMGFPWEREDFCAAQNEYFRTVAESSGGSIIPFASVPVNRTARIDAWVREIKDMGFRGVGEVSYYRNGMNSESIDHLRSLLSAARSYSLPVCLHVNEPVGHRYPGKYDPLLQEVHAAVAEHPDVVVILSHWGGGLLFYELMPEVSRSLKNCYYDTAATPLLYADEIYGIAYRITGSKKILFGTDYPLLSADRYIDAIKKSIPDEESLADI